jgi:heat shock protein HtpX
LLNGLSRAEVAGILAHEVAHVVNRDAGAMNWAAAIQNKIASLALNGAAEMAARRPDPADVSQGSIVLASTPAIARLLFLAPSRVRELDAGALALDLTDDPGALAAALCKLEHFHTGLSPLGAHLRGNALSRSLDSHPDTWERIARLA